MIGRRRSAWLLAAGLLAACTPPPRTSKGGAEQLRALPAPIAPLTFLSDAVDRAREAGAGELEPIGGAVLAEGEQIGSFVEIPDGECMLGIARAGSSVRDVDLFVYSDAGDRLASDESPEPGASVLVCPPHPRRVYVTARVMNGDGMLALGVMSVATSRADAVAKSVGVRGRPGQDTGKLEAWPGLERQVRERRRGLGGQWEDVRRVAMPLDPGAYSSVSVTIEPRRCLDVLIVPSEEIQGLDALAMDPQGRVISYARPPGRERSFVLCSEVEQTVTIMARPRLSNGLAALVVGRSAAGAASELDDSVWMDGATALVPMDRALARHRARLQGLAMAAERTLASVTVGVGAANQHPLQLPDGCARVDVVAATPLAHFAAELWSKQQRLLDSARGGERATLFRCGPAAEVDLELTAQERAGPVTVLSRVDAKPPALLRSHPMAAARLLGRLEDQLGPIDIAVAAKVEAQSLKGGERKRLRLEVEPERCVQTFAALDGSASGLALRLWDGSRELETVRGADVASIRACAGKQERVLALELSAGSAAAEVLLLRRVE